MKGGQNEFVNTLSNIDVTEYIKNIIIYLLNCEILFVYEIVKKPHNLIFTLIRYILTQKN